MWSPLKSPSKSPKKTISSILKDHGVSPTKSPNKARKSLASIPLIVEAPPIMSNPTKTTRTAAKNVATTTTTNNMAQILGKGPMQFGPPQEPLSVKEAMRHPSHLEAYIRLTMALEEQGLQDKFRETQVLRVARYHKFHVDKCIKLLKRMDPLYWNTSMEQMVQQLHTHTIFPLPRSNKLVSKDKSMTSFVYMNAARFVPSQMSTTAALLANLVYVMDTMDHVTDQGHRQSMGLIVNLTHQWTMDNFAPDAWKQLVETWQGKKGPVHMDMVLFINPPVVFEKKAWPAIKAMMSSSFRPKVHLIPQQDMKEFMAPGFEAHLPNELEGGRLVVEQAVEDFIRYREYIEEQLYPDERHPTKETAQLLRSSKRSASSSSKVWSNNSQHNMSSSMHTIDLAFGQTEHSAQSSPLMTRNSPHEASLSVM